MLPSASPSPGARSASAPSRTARRTSSASLVDRLRADRPAAEAPPTFFEATTAMALACFRAAGVRVAVLEVGMGGRFDATNVARPVAVAIPSIDLDHQRFLGSTVEEIAFEKAGVIGRGRGGGLRRAEAGARGEVLAAGRPRARRAVRGRPRRHGPAAPRLREGRTEVDRLATPRGRYGPLTLALRGGHQAPQRRRGGARAGGARRRRPRGPRRRDRACADQGPLAGPARSAGRGIPGRRVLLDAAHNVAAAAAFARLRPRDRPGGSAPRVRRAARQGCRGHGAGDRPRRQPHRLRAGRLAPRAAGRRSWRSWCAGCAPAPRSAWRGARAKRWPRLGGTVRWPAPRARSTWSGRSSRGLEPVRPTPTP